MTTIPGHLRIGEVTGMHSEEKKVRENGLRGQIDWGSSLHLDISNLAWESHLIQANNFFYFEY